jgi:GNAT superfamily N-acetyltransferase
MPAGWQRRDTVLDTLLRQARRDDIAGMHKVRMSVQENWLVSTTLTQDDYIQAIEATGRGWVIELHGTVLAFAVGDASSGSIWALFVEPGHEGRGFGRQLHDCMVAWLWQQGFERLWLTTDPGTRAYRFYETAGWQRVGEAAHGEVRLELVHKAQFRPA